MYKLISIMILMVSLRIQGEGEGQATPKIWYVPVIKATAESTQEYGRIIEDKDSGLVDIVTWPAGGWRPIAPGTGNKAGTTSAIIKTRWEGDYCYATFQNTQYLIGWSTTTQGEGAAPRSVVITHEVDYHPDSGQLLYPVDNKPFVLVLALPGDDISPQDFVAFYFDGTVGFHINPGVWHQLPFPLEDTLELYNEQGAVFACVDCEFVPEFDCLLAIDLHFLPELKKK